MVWDQPFYSVVHPAGDNRDILKILHILSLFLVCACCRTHTLYKAARHPKEASVSAALSRLHLVAIQLETFLARPRAESNDPMASISSG